ncbi:MAG: CRTAC1 family protein [Pseudomonadota bacterium]
MRAWVCVALLCSTAPALAIEFVEAAKNTGLKFLHRADASARHLLPEIMGGGLAVLDANNDGRPDVYAVGGTEGHSRLFLQQDNGKFVGVPISPDHGGFGMGAAQGDVNGDDLVDLYLTGVGPDRLYLNQGGGRFVEHSNAGIDVPEWSTSAAFCDLDGDTDLDLYVATYVESDATQVCSAQDHSRDYCPPNVYPYRADRVFINDGAGGFAEGLQGLAPEPAPALGVVCVDVDGDHDQDVLVANDGTANFLWLNQGDGHFVERGVLWGVAANLFGESEAGMGIAVADLNDDLRPDFLLTHVDRESNTLYTSVPGGYVDHSIRSGLGAPSVAFTGFGVAFLDAQLDGDVDAIVGNGRVRKPWIEDVAPGSARSEEENYRLAYGEGNQFFLGHDEGFRHRRVSGLLGREVTRGLLAVDVDRDGDEDVLATNGNGELRLWRNDSARAGAWLGVQLRGAAAHGARITLINGETRWTRWLLHSVSYLSSGLLEAHFGLGEISGPVSAAVVWPDGQIERFRIEQLNRWVVLDRGTGT